MPDLTTNSVPGFFDEYCAIASKESPANFIAVGLTPGGAHADGKEALGIDSKAFEAGYQIVRSFEEQYRAFRKE